MSSELLQTFPQTRNYKMAAVAALRLLRNKEDTPQIFRVYDALNGPRTEKNFARYRACPEGRARIEDGTDVEAIFSDTEMLAALPENTFGAAYHRFMTAEGLSAQGLAAIIDEADLSAKYLEPERKRFVTNGFHLHDLIHILYDYGRDLIGETCNLVIMGRQLHLSSISGISYVLASIQKAQSPRRPVYACLNEARNIADAAVWLNTADWGRFVSTDINEVRAELNVLMPEIYLANKQFFSHVDAERREKLNATLPA